MSDIWHHSFSVFVSQGVPAPACCNEGGRECHRGDRTGNYTIIQDKATPVLGNRDRYDSQIDGHAPAAISVLTKQKHPSIRAATQT